MRIAFIVDGLSEYEALPVLYTQLRRATGATFVRIVKADIQPLDTIPRIANVCIKSANVLMSSRPDLLIILIDRESRSDCPGDLARQVRVAVEKSSDCRTAVVIKDRCFENWLISDPIALKSLSGKFILSNRVVSAIVPDKADAANALDVLKRSARPNQGYKKIPDSTKIPQASDISRMAQNSRSFRRLLRCLGHPSYLTQSRHPASVP